MWHLAPDLTHSAHFGTMDRASHRVRKCLTLWGQQLSWGMEGTNTPSHSPGLLNVISLGHRDDTLIPPDSKQSQAPCPSAHPSSDTCLQGAVRGEGTAFTLELAISCAGKSPDNLLSLLSCCWGRNICSCCTKFHCCCIRDMSS